MNQSETSIASGQSSVASKTTLIRRRWSTWLNSWPQRRRQQQVEQISANNCIQHRLTRFRRNLSVQKLNDQEKKTINSFSSVNYSPTHSVSYIQWLANQKDRFYTRLNLDRWFLVLLMGITIGLIAALLKQSITGLMNLQWNKTKNYLNNGQVLSGFWFAAGVNCAYGIVSAILITCIHPPAAGGGTPEVIAFLNGIIVHGTLSMKNLVVKFIANVFAVGSGLPAAIQAPLITYGAIVGAGIGQFQSKALGFKPNVFTRFHNAHDRREFTTAGVSGGVSAGFNAPIGGLLFAMEDLSSFWTKSSSMQTFVCCIISTIAAQLFNAPFSGFKLQHNKTHFGKITASVIIPIQMHILTLIPAALLGIVSGLLGAFFTRANTFICKQRKKFLSKIPNPWVQRIVRVLETLLVVILMTAYSVFLPFGFSCSKVERNLTQMQSLSLSSAGFVGCQNSSSTSLFKYSTFNCPPVPDNSTFIYFNAMSTLIQGSGTAYLKKLWSRTTYFVFDYDVCLSAFAVYFVLTIWTAGTAISGGVFVPLLISGSLYGRALGVGMVHAWMAITGTPYPSPEWRWLDPGIMAAIAGASLVSGVNRLAVATTVIVLEMVGDINLIIPNLVAIFFSKCVADHLSKPLYKYQLDAKALPYLDHQPHVIVAGKQLNLELCRVSDVMTQPVATLQVRETVGSLARLLLSTGHSGYPVVKSDDEDGENIVYGFLTRNELYVILCSDDVFKQETPGAVVTPIIPYEELSVDYIADKMAAEERIRSYSRFKIYSQILVDLEPFINISTPKIDRDYSLHRTYVIFRTLGLRHLVVVDGRNRIVGIVTRKNLLQFQMQERLEALLQLTAVRANTDALPSTGGSADGATAGSTIDFNNNNNNSSNTNVEELDHRDGSPSVAASGREGALRRRRSSVEIVGTLPASRSSDGQTKTDGDHVKVADEWPETVREEETLYRRVQAPDVEVHLDYEMMAKRRRGDEWSAAVAEEEGVYEGDDNNEQEEDVESGHKASSGSETPL